MAIYFFSSSLPELQHLPDEVRDDIVETALYNIPITRWNLFSFVAVLFPIVTIFGFLDQLVWPGFRYVYLVVAYFPVSVWWLNTARPTIRRLVEDFDREKGKSL